MKFVDDDDDDDDDEVTQKYSDYSLSVGLSHHASAITSDRDCLEVKREYYQNCSVLGCVTQCSQSAAHLYEQFLQVQRLGLSHWDPYAMHRGGCLDLYYCNMVEWSWWDSAFICKTN